MANFQSRQIIENMPVASHGMGSSAKVAHFVVDLTAATAASDTLELGYLPDYAVPYDVVCVSSAAVATGLDIGYAVDTDGLVDGITLTANIPARSAAAAPLIGKNVGAAQRKVVGVFQGIAAIGVLHVFISYTVEDQGVGYPYVAIS